jgi:transcription elongation factor Elf1
MSTELRTKDSLLRCPFCGWAAMPCQGKDEAWPHIVKCTNCQARTDDSPTPEAAANLWNMRDNA